LIKAKCTELLPNYLRFVRGVIDCADIPLSISRETYQDSTLIFKLKTVITRRILKRLEEEARNDPENYDKWYEEFHQQLKEGILTDSDNSESIMRLQRYKGTFNNGKVGLEDYIKQMQNGQDKIYFIINTDVESTSSVYLESLEGTNVPVLISNNPFDEVIFRQIANFKSIY